MMGLVKHWSKLPIEVVDATFLGGWKGLKSNLV